MYGFGEDEAHELAETIPELCAYDLWNGFCEVGYTAYSEVA